MEVVDVLRLEAICAKEANVQRVTELFNFVKENRPRFDVLVVYKLDRFVRNAQQYLWLRGDFLKIQVGLRSATEKIDETPQGKFLETILAGVNEYDNSIRIERVKNGLWKRVEERKKVKVFQAIDRENHQ